MSSEKFKPPTGGKPIEKPKIGGLKTGEKPVGGKPGEKIRKISGSGASEALEFEARQRMDEIAELTVEEIKKLASNEINERFSEINAFIEKEEKSIKKLEEQSADAEQDEKIDAINLYKEDLTRIKEAKEKILKSVIELVNEKSQIRITGPGGETAFKSAVLDLGFKKEVANEVYDSFISGLEGYSYVKQAESVPAPIIEPAPDLKTEIKKSEKIKELGHEVIDRINKITDIDFNIRREKDRGKLSKLVEERKNIIDFAIEKIKELPDAENLLKESFDLNDLKIISQYKYEAGAVISKVPEEMMEGYSNAVGRKKNFITRLGSLGLKEEAINDIYEKLAERAIESSVKARIGEHELKTVSGENEEKKAEAKEKPEIIKLSDAILKEIREKSAEISEIHKVLKTIEKGGNEELIEKLEEEGKKKYREIENLGKELKEAEEAEELRFKKETGGPVVEKLPPEAPEAVVPAVEAKKEFGFEFIIDKTEEIKAKIESKRSELKALQDKDKEEREKNISLLKEELKNAEKKDEELAAHLEDKIREAGKYKTNEFLESEKRLQEEIAQLEIELSQAEKLKEEAAKNIELAKKEIETKEARGESEKFKIELNEARKAFASVDSDNPKYKEIQERYQNAVGQMRGFLYRTKKDTLEKSGLNPEEIEKELEKYTREIIIPHFAVVEAAKIQNERTEKTFIEKTKDSRVAKFFYGIVDKYRKIPFKQKMYISGALIAGGMLSGGLAPAIAGIITGGVGLQRILGGAGSAVAAEALMQKSQKKWMEKEGWGKNRHEFVSKEIDKIRQLAKQKELKEEELERVGGMEETEKLLNERQELIKKLEIRRTAIAGMVGFLVGSGAAFQAVKQYGEWTGVTEVLKEKGRHIFSWLSENVKIRGEGATPQPHPAPEHLGVKTPEKIIPLTPHEVAPVAPAPSVEMLPKLEIGARGPEGAIIDYFKGHPDIAKTFGWDGESDLKKWAGGAAHRLWLADADQALSKQDTLAELKRLGYPQNAEGYAQMMRRIGKGLVEIDPINKNINLVDTEYLKNNIKELEKLVSEPIIHGDKVPVPEEIMPLEPIPGEKVPVPEEIVPFESELIHGEGMPEEISQDSTMAKHLEEIAREAGGENIIRNVKSGTMGIFEYASDGKIKDFYVSGRVNPLEAQKLLNDNWRALVMEKFTNFDLQSKIIGTRAGAIYQYEQIWETLKQQGKGSGPEAEFIKNKIGMIKKLTEGKYGDVFK